MRGGRRGGEMMRGKGENGRGREEKDGEERR